MNILAAIKDASERLEHAGVADPKREAASLLSYALDKPTAFLIAHPEYELSEEEFATWSAVLERRVQREPFQYIVGRQEFWGLDLEVGPGVLIPRPETEFLVEAAIDELRSLLRPRFAEVGLGSGCISISILSSLQDATAIATDVSKEAIAIAKRNAEKHSVADRLEIRRADLFAGIQEEFHLIVSNPPYIPEDDIKDLQPEVRIYEPYGALAGGHDGLDIVRRMVDGSGHLLIDGGVLMMEIGIDQAVAVAELFDQRGWHPAEFVNDLQGIPRVVVARRVDVRPRSNLAPRADWE